MLFHTNDFISGTYIILFLKDGHLVKSENLLFHINNFYWHEIFIYIHLILFYIQ